MTGKVIPLKNTSIPIMTHEKIEERREQLKTDDRDKFFELKTVRYALFRMQTFLDGGCMPEAEHVAIAKKLEDDVKGLGGMEAFAKRWDIDPLTSRVVQRDRSVWVAHEQKMDQVANKIELMT